MIYNKKFLNWNQNHPKSYTYEKNYFSQLLLFHVFNFYAQYNNTYEEKLFKTIKNKNEIDAFDILNGIGYNEKLYSKGKNEIEVFVK